jgi:hypothetical protein
MSTSIVYLPILFYQLQGGNENDPPTLDTLFSITYTKGGTFGDSKASSKTSKFVVSNGCFIVLCYLMIMTYLLVQAPKSDCSALRHIFRSKGC